MTNETLYEVFDESKFTIFIDIDHQSSQKMNALNNIFEQYKRCPP